MFPKWSPSSAHHVAPGKTTPDGIPEPDVNWAEKRPGPLTRPGSLLSQTLRIVCKTCNGGWMSKLQTAAKALMEPILRGEPWPTMGGDDQFVLAKWAMMTTMVLEQADRDTMAISAETRRSFAADGTMPAFSVIWIGRYGGEIDFQWFHRGWTYQDDLGVVKSPASTASCMLHVGSIVFLVFASQNSALVVDEWPIGRTARMTPIWPNGASKLSTPIIPMDVEHLNYARFALSIALSREADPSKHEGQAGAPSYLGRR